MTFLNQRRSKKPECKKRFFRKIKIKRIAFSRGFNIYKGTESQNYHCISYHEIPSLAYV